MEDLDQEENGWKIIHTDVFRYPPQKNLFCAILGKWSMISESENGACWSSGSRFNCRSRGLWFEFYTGPNMNFSVHKKLNSEVSLEQSMNWYPERAVSVQVWYSLALFVGCTQNQAWNSFLRETRRLVS